MKRKYHYEYHYMTDNLCWGRMLLGKGKTPTEAKINARKGDFGATIMLKKRVYD